MKGLGIYEEPSFPLLKSRLETISIPVPHINGTKNNPVLKTRPDPNLILTNPDWVRQLTARQPSILVTLFFPKNLGSGSIHK
jgi:hypothetical protein